MNLSLLEYKRQLEFDKVTANVAEHAVSTEGKEKIGKLMPSNSLFEVSHELELTDTIYTLLQKSRIPGISAIDGIIEIAKRAEKGGMLSMAELLKVRIMLRNANVLLSWYSSGQERLVTDELFFFLYEDANLERDISSSILSETEMSDDASLELLGIRKRIVGAENSIRDKLDGIIRSDSTKKVLQDSVITMRNGRFVVPVKAESRSNFKGLVHDVSQSGATYFIEPEAVVEANNRIMELKNEEAREIERILFVFTSRVGEISEQLEKSYKSYVEIDVLLAKAKYGIEIKASKPFVNDKGYINLKKARHPLINKDIVVPIDVSLGNSYRVLVITGPNTGGKTVTLKTIGLLSLMAMSGLLLPVAEESEISVFNMIYADVGDEQSIEQSLSTFSGHITNIARILSSATSDSLVLLDELGAGTDPAEGAALAIAILDRFHDIGCKAVATTHYGEIKAYAIKTDMVENASCEFDINTLLPTYKLTIGIPGSSNALAIAAKLGLDKRIVDVAQSNMNSGNRHFEDVLKDLEEVRSDLEKKQSLSEELHSEAKQALILANEQARVLYEEAKKESDRAKNKARQLSADVEAEAQKLLKEMRELRDNEGDRRAVIARAREIARKDSILLVDRTHGSENIDISSLETVKEIIVGQTVFLSTIEQLVEILSPENEDGYVEVKAGLIKSRVHKDTLKIPPTEKESTSDKKKKYKSSEATLGERSSKNELNLLGLNVDEAILETERFIDGAMFSKFSTVYLIHGKGTGALRSAIQQHLKKMKQVKRFRLGGYGEGDSGVTIVELK